MTRSALSSRLLALVDSDLDELSELSAKSKTSNKAKPDKMTVAKKARGRPPAPNKVTKPAQKSTRRTSGRFAAAATATARNAGSADYVEKLSKADTKAPRRGRKAKASDEFEAEDEDMAGAEDSTLSAPTSAVESRDRPKTTAAAAVKGEKAKEVAGSVVKPAALATKRGRPPGNKSRRHDRAEVPESQPPEVLDIDINDDRLEGLFTPHRAAHPIPRPDGGSDAAVSDAQLRRRLGEVKRKCESLELKYRDLRDIGVKAAERNFENLKRESEERATAANELISSLKADLAAQRNLAKEGQQHMEKLEKMEAIVADLTASLAEAKQEVKALSTRLAASRSAEAAATTATARVPGSAIKGGNAVARGIVSSDAVQTAQLKEDLYGDLTGLIVRVVKRDTMGQIFDCIQTGRNGTLHFKLEIESESSDGHYEEAQFTYKPQLDPNRDRDLIDLLPDFLAEEIEFSRPHAAKFYSRVTKSLME